MNKVSVIKEDHSGKKNLPLGKFWVEQPMWASHPEMFGLYYQHKISIVQYKDIFGWKL